jgi:predicted ATPase
MERLLIAKMNKLEVIQEISDRFKDVFPEVAEIKFNEIRTPGQDKGHIEYQLKPKKSQKLVPHWNISSGMLRILNYLIEAYLANEDTVFLIDEFENSLGHNCLPFLAEDILNRSISQQFIMTSHHPDIINEFEMNSWLVISRSNGRIQNTRPEALPLGRTKHVPYRALMNYFETTSS